MSWEKPPARDRLIVAIFVVTIVLAAIGCALFVRVG